MIACPGIASSLIRTLKVMDRVAVSVIFGYTAVTFPFTTVIDVGLGSLPLLAILFSTYVKPLGKLSVIVT